ncbi:MAG: Type II site-specific deoxyribonuclease [Parcubacteria group bacterium GW2011_GWA2_33_14]|uniref:Restriction endonuclease n=1 Tax=Candidatus Staskawiczbacteria bacterium RIFCSPHIGHO2_02_FULL_33_16 TaxID=1802204 RepID=A0A1G2HY16_9BACT|nr:MAG: Type II site-specific deoxyribonuclease [Parcubacteria group bacterium GW2011_GWA2_33_14]OGZ67444.1 MAG: restriction endonuclease [Candidatus Staskawiczbacteria bacterium RIFCSPHIGHO2_02_FULL_33_16]OGZ70959.1 MAG: restriction endonuclease [Candidatus Staskawiczbacteria bacterium RIFCSPLOWO2_01_FULL_33_13]
METNILIALKNLVKDPVTNLVSRYRGVNRANSMGDALEFYIKDLFCNSLNEENLVKKDEAYSKYFSYLGNQNNPPDIMIKSGDAIEVKKVEGLDAGIALNSSYPKDKLFSDSSMITTACRNAENWREKDLIYTIGVVKEDKLKALWFIYGNCYSANKEVYERIRDKISKGVNELQSVEFSETNELGRVNKVDPLGITYLRIRGMWGIENPIKVFNYVAPVNRNVELSVNALMLKEKYLSFPEKDRKNLEKLVGDKFTIKDIKIKSPNNPAKLLDAKLLTFIK